MSDRRRRAKIDIDYLHFHKTGEKILKIDRSEKMDLSEKKVKEMQICEDIAESLTIYELEKLDTESEISEGIEQIIELGRQFRHIHIELKATMGEKDHAESYERYGDTCETIRNFVKSAREKVKLVKKVEKEMEEQKFENERISEVNKVKYSLRIEEQVFREKLEREISASEHTENDEIKARCAKFDILLDEYYKLLSRFKIAFGENYESEYKEIFDNTVMRISENIESGKKEIKKLNVQAEENIAIAKTKNDNLRHETFIEEQKFHAGILAKEIEMRCESLIKKCDSSVLEKMSDHQIFECFKNMSTIDCEMREIFDKISAFAKIASLCGDKRDEMLFQPHDHQEKALDARNSFFMKLHAIFVERDISEEKLKNACTLNIELVKFKGYDSKLDIYSFKTEFEKLIMPRYQKCYWVDTLKKNYLSGSAYTLVEKVNNIQEIWAKLISAYGNVKLLLQNKISNLDQIETLEKVKGDEKIANALAKILNMMTELKTLAEKHKLEYKLYVGGGLEKVLTLIGDERERKFLSKMYEKTSVSNDASEVLAEKLEWEKLFDFLKREMAYREKLTLVQKSKSCLGINSEVKSVPKDKKGKTAFHSSIVELKCHICGKSDHVISVDKNGKKQVDYFSCKTFVDMSPKERHVELQKKKFCWQCLIPGMRYDEKHTCFDKYVCSDSYHKKYSRGLHVLVCDTHKKNQSNLDLLQEYKMNVISKRSSNFQNFTKNISLVCLNDCDSKLKSSDFGKGNEKVLPDVFDSAIFMLQTIKVGEKNFNIFYDTGCGDIVVKKSAIDALISMGRANLELPGPIILSGVGDHKSVCEYGMYSICLPLKSGFDAVLSGTCLDRVTSNFPKYKLKEVEGDIRKQCKKQGEVSLDTLPKLPREVGGETDILIGLKYQKYHPQKVWESSTGLSLSDSCFLSADGTTGVIGGPHPAFTKADWKRKNAQTGKLDTFPVYTCALNAYRSEYRVCSEMPLLGEKFDVIRDECTSLQNNQFVPYDYSIFSGSRLISEVQLEPGIVSNVQPEHSINSEVKLKHSIGSVVQLEPGIVSDVQTEHSINSEVQLEPSMGSGVRSEVGNYRNPVFAARRAPKCLKTFDEAESAGIEITYRCVSCRNCQDCKRSSRIDSVSIQEEIEQDLINRSVKSDLGKGRTTHMLPFVTNPDTKLPAAEKNEKLARKLYESQIKGLENKPDDKEAIVKSEGKLQELAFVDYFDNLPDEDREAIVNSLVKCFVPWRTVWNANSLSTPCRLVFDPGSQLVMGCEDMVLNFVDFNYKLSVEFGVEFKKCPVGAHNVHGKVERKIRQIKRSFEKVLNNQRRSLIQWETLGQQIVNSINNFPIGIGNKTGCLENLDLLTPNRLLLGRNNDRCPTAPLILSHDTKKIIATNSDIFNTWFDSWLVSYVPTLVEKPKWFKTDRHVCKGDIVLFLKSEKEFGNQYQYGIIRAVYVSKDGHIRAVDVQYRNHNENTTRTTKRGVRDLVVIHPVDEIGINAELYELSKN